MKAELITILLIVCSVFAYAQQDLKLKKNGDLWGYVNKSDSVIIDFQFESAGYFHNGLAAVKRNGSYLTIDRSGNAITALPGYESVNWIVEDQPDLYLAVKNNKKGIINAQGKVLIPCQYDRLTPWAKDGHVLVALINDKVGIIKTDGSVIIPVKYTWQYQQDFLYDGDITYFRPGKQFPLFDGKNWGVIDANGKEVVPFNYKEIILVDNTADYGKFKFAALREKDKFKIIDSQGKDVFNELFEDVYGEYDKNHLAVKRKGAVAFYDLAAKAFVNEVPIGGKYSLKYSVFKRSGLFGAIHRTGVLMAPFEFHYIRVDEENNEHPERSTLRVSTKDGSGIYSVTKGYIVQPIYHNVYGLKFEDKYFYVAARSSDGKNALLNAQGVPLTEFEFRNIINSQGKLHVFKDKQKGVVDAEGHVTWDVN